MTLADFAQAFAASYPKAVDFLKSEYEAHAAAVDALAAEAGYRKAGERLGFVVFTTKKNDAVLQ
jgi:hypothetical protein